MDSLDEALIDTILEEYGLKKLDWTQKGPIVAQTLKISPLYRETNPIKKLVIDYLRDGETYNLQMSLIFPGKQQINIKQPEVFVWFGANNRAEDSHSCRISNEMLDQLAHRYFLKLREVTFDYQR